ncbi:unnamed protein product [Lepeophtheirus salmonis]|uniref:(salmon louse) hypothetical protein n=1 Tax=Lepeophtheirus salmonis TaxID=72036 RepID=A0A7R8H8P7_LEPSM|nr:unnamed protein product [Lepeophtheirus salmonis]CAF2926618.1 unnamed protein product [Lepeophtheirus salmonis]
MKRQDEAANLATQASFKVADILKEWKNPFTDAGIVEEAMTAVAEILFRDFKNKDEIFSAIADVQLSTNTRIVSALSMDAVKQLDLDMNRSKWLSIQCNASVDCSDTSQLAVFIGTVFDDFSTKDESLTLLPFKNTTRGVVIYNAVKDYFAEKKIPFEKLVSETTDRAPCNDQSSLRIYCTLQDGSSIPFKVRQSNTEASNSSWRNDLQVWGSPLHTEVKWLRQGKILQGFLFLLCEKKAFIETRDEDTSLLSDAEWLHNQCF